MAQVIQAKCPGCKKVLRIPSNWVQQAIKCKHCGTVLQARAKAKAAAEAVPPPLPRRAADGNRSAAVLPPFETQDGTIIRTKYRRSSSGLWWKALLVVLFVGAAISTGLVLLAHRLAQRQEVAATTDAPEDRPAIVPKEKGDPVAAEEKELPSDVPFPRRALGICVSNYLYANPVGYGVAGQSGQNLHSLMLKLSRVLRIPPDQVTELSDATFVPAPRPTAPSQPKGKRKAQPVREVVPTSHAPSAIPPTKAVLEQAITDFLATSRPQDRIVLLFAGHATVVDDDAYLVPLEGDFADKQTLIPLKWVYARLSECKARQKVFVVDVCRFDPTRGAERPGGGPMSAKLDQALSAPPPGVQVWSACTAEQFSCEFDAGSVFLDQLHANLKQSVLKRIQKPTESLPLEVLVPAVNKATEEEVQLQQKAKQTPRLAGSEPTAGTPYEPAEPPPPKLVVQPPLLPKGGNARRDELVTLLREIDIPPLKLGRATSAEQPLDKLVTLIPFSAETMAEYKADYADIRKFLGIPGKREQFPLRAAVIDAVDVLRKYAKQPLREDFRGGGDNAKKEILQAQREPARILLDMEEAEAALRKAGEDRAAEKSNRWQAHYDYVLAQLLARVVYVHEYNLMLGRIRQDRLPELTPGIHNGWRLASREKPQSSKEIRDKADESRKLLNRLAQKHRGTPWEVLARRERVAALGLEWQPSR